MEILGVFCYFIISDGGKTILKTKEREGAAVTMLLVATHSGPFCAPPVGH